MKSEGKCGFCNKTVSGSAMMRHLKTCQKRIEANEADNAHGRVFLLRASASPFFVYFETSTSSTLKKVDQFLRDLWLECCGHLSAFEIENTKYFSSSIDLEYDEKDMKAKLGGVIKPGIEFLYEYDFGTTTQLGMKCISERKGNMEGIAILARNSMPDFKCSKCKRPATEICTECIWKGKGLLCKECIKEHKCEEEMLLPLVNSPRTGMCGYTGETNDY